MSEGLRSEYSSMIFYCGREMPRMKLLEIYAGTLSIKRRIGLLSQIKIPCRHWLLLRARRNDGSPFFATALIVNYSANLCYRGVRYFESRRATLYSLVWFSITLGLSLAARGGLKRRGC